MRLARDRWHVEGVAGFDDFLVVAVTDGQPSGDHVAPVRALGAAAGESLRERREVGVFPDRGELTVYPSKWSVRSSAGP